MPYKLNVFKGDAIRLYYAYVLHHTILYVFTLSYPGTLE